MKEKNTCTFCGKKITDGGGGMGFFSGSDLSNLSDLANQMLAKKLVCPSCSSIFCLECGNKKGHSLGSGSTHCPKCGVKVL